jgi:hypothetical protein
MDHKNEYKYLQAKSIKKGFYRVNQNYYILIILYILKIVYSTVNRKKTLVIRNHNNL